jgi:SAM-dependent methyltransferase
MSDPYGDIAAYYDLIYGTDIDYEGESQGLLHLFKENRVRRVLDIGCGTASHLIRLARSGCEVSGVDISEKMIEVGRNKAAAESLGIDLRPGDMNDIRGIGLSGSFDAVISLYAPGLNSGPDRLAHSLRDLHPLLADGGLLVVNLMNADCPFFTEAAPDLSFDGAEADGIKAVWFYQTVVKVKERQQHLSAVYLIEDGGAVSMFVHHHRITTFTRAEVEKLLTGCGFQSRSVFGSLTGLPPFRGEEPAMWILAQKR